jgi:hypothetical protein
MTGRWLGMAEPEPAIKDSGPLDLNGIVVKFDKRKHDH